MFPLVTFDSIPLNEANQLLVKWGHKMGPINRPMGIAQAHGLIYDQQLVAVVISADLVSPTVGGASFLNRDNAIELARVCAREKDWNRVALRLWRLAVFPGFKKNYAVSYQDAKLHTGDLYRFDGWTKCGYSHSGTDRRSGRKGRDKFIWVWPNPITTNN
jgi:antitoxin VapB